MSSGGFEHPASGGPASAFGVGVGVGGLVGVGFVGFEGLVDVPVVAPPEEEEEEAPSGFEDDGSGTPSAFPPQASKAVEART